MHPWIPTLIPLLRTTMNLQVPVSFLLLSRESQIYGCWFLFYLEQEHMITDISNFTAPSPMIYNLSQVILGYATLNQALILLRTHISISQKYTKCLHASWHWSSNNIEWVDIKGLWNCWMLSTQANMDSDTNPNFSHQEITSRPLPSNSVRVVPRKRPAVFGVHILALI